MVLRSADYAKVLKFLVEKSQIGVAAMKYQSILIITYGRTGSTLLQGLLNSINGCLVRGENYNFCYGLFQAWKSLKKTHRNHWKEVSPTQPFYGAGELDPDQFIKDMAVAVRNQLVGKSDASDVFCLGFKEIRYLEVKQDELPEFLDFLALIFPNPAFVILTRRHQDVVKSGWWIKHDPDQLIKKFAKFEDAVFSWANRKDNVFHIQYEEICSQDNKLVNLFHFLGAPYNPDRVAAVLAQEHSFGNRNKIHLYTSSLVPVPCKLIQEIILDPLPSDNPLAAPKVISGVVLPVKSAIEGARLVLRSDSRIWDVQWLIPSPVIGAKYPDIHFAQTARFYAKLNADDSPNELCLVTSDGEVHVIARCT
jgi:hypothetical protein